MLKQCTGCQQTKPFDQFYRRRNRPAGKPTGYDSRCIACSRTTHQVCDQCHEPRTQHQFATNQTTCNRCFLHAGQKVCGRCQQLKPLGEFHKNAKRTGGYQPACKQCTATKSFATRDVAAAYKRKRTFGLSDDDYQRMLEQQQHVCAICHQPERQLRRGRLVALHVDHDHKTGKVRQLLCTKCNAGLGYFDDNPERMQQAAAYLEKHKDVQNVSREL